jgi:hypothetical protein
MLKFKVFAIISTTVVCLILENSSLSSLEAQPAATPSRGTAGSTSGAGTTGSSVLGPSIQTGSLSTITPAIQTTLNNVGGQVVANLTQAGGLSSSLVSVLGTSVSNLSISSAISILSSTNIQGITTSTPITLSNGVLLSATSNGNGSVTISVSGNINGTLNISTVGTSNPQGATVAAAAVVASGGTPEQALLASALVGSSRSVNSTSVIQLINSLTGLLSNNQASLPNPNLRASLDNLTNLNPRIEDNFLREKSFASTLIAQQKGVSVNAEKLNQAILAYNNLIDASSPEALQALSKNKEFITIGDNLRKLRDAANI